MSENNNPDYVSLKRWVSQAPRTWLPGLLRHVVSVSVQSGVFAGNGLIRLVESAMTGEPPWAASSLGHNDSVCDCGKPSVRNEGTGRYVGACEDCLPF